MTSCGARGPHGMPAGSLESTRSASGRRRRTAAAAGLRVLSGAEAAPLLTAALAPPPEAALAYRDWLQQRFNRRAA